MDGGAGYYNVEIAYVNEGNNRITVTATYLYPAKVNLAMFSNDWNFIEMEWNNENTVCSVSRNLELGQVPDSFKIVVTQGASTAWYGNNGQMNRVYYENWTFATTEPNCRLLVDVPGQYNFAFTLASKNVTVAYPTSFTREAATTNYQTLCVPFDAEKPAGVTIYEVTNVSASSVTIEVPDLAYLVAGKSYIIKPEAAGNIVITKKAEGNSVAAPINTFMYGILGVDYQPTADLGAYVLSGNQFHLVAEDGAATVSSTRAYVKAVDASAAPALRIVEGGNDATNIENLGADETAVKFIQNGQLFIKRNGVVYSATGAVVK